MQLHHRIVFLYPGPQALGGITAVVENYRRSAFSEQYRCAYFGTCTETGYWGKLVYSLLRLLAFIVFVVVKKPTVAAIHTGSGMSFYRKSLFGLVARALGVSVVFHVHPSHFYDFYMSVGAFRRVYVHWVLGLSKTLIFLTEEMAAKFRGEFPDKNIFVLPNPVHCAPYQAIPRRPMSGNHTILYLGWIIAGKGVYDIVDVIAEVADLFPDVRFVFAGSKEVEKLRHSIQGKEIQKYAEVLDWVEEDEKIKLLRTSRLLLLPTYTEGIPNVILEAMASGLPTITTPVGGIPSVFSEGTNGYYIPPGNKGDLKVMIIRLLGDDLECERLSRATQASSREYDVETVGAKLEKIYSKILHQEEI